MCVRVCDTVWVCDVMRFTLHSLDSTWEFAVCPPTCLPRSCPWFDSNIASHSLATSMIALGTVSPCPVAGFLVHHTPTHSLAAVAPAVVVHNALARHELRAPLGGEHHIRVGVGGEGLGEELLIGVGAVQVWWAGMERK